MITVNKKWHYLAVKSLSALLRRITSTNNGDFYCLNCLLSFRTENKLKEHRNACENHDYCHIKMPKEGNNVSRYNHGEKSMKPPFIIYADLESLLEKIITCRNNLKESSTTKINKHTASGYSLFIHCSFDVTKNKLDYYRGHDCIKMFCKDLKEHATKIINYEKKKKYHYQFKKMNHILSKKFAIYAKNNLLLILRVAVKICL